MANAPTTVVPNDMKPEIDELEKIIDAAAMGEGEMPPTETDDAPADEMAGEEAPGEGEDAQAIADALQIDIGQAQALYDAAQQMEMTRGVPAAELADMIAQDVDLRMQLEQLAAGAADMAMEMAEE